MAVKGYDPDLGLDDVGDSLFEVELCSGEKLWVQTEAEQRWFVKSKGKYLSETRFEETTDMHDLDRLLCLELLMFRWNFQLAGGRDYDGNFVDAEVLRRNVKDQSDTINKLKAQLALDKKSRDAILNEGNFASWIEDVKRRAKLFGIHRENQLSVALSLQSEIAATVGAFDRSDLEERRKLGFEAEKDIVDWLRTYVIPKYAEIDAHFVNNEQRLWKRDM